MAYPNQSTASVRNTFEDILARLLRAEEQSIPDIVAVLPANQRASLAVFCYARGHLHRIGLAVAATCDQLSLVQASPSDAAGNVLFAQSRELPKRSGGAVSGARSRITLARSASGNSSLAGIIASIAGDESVDLQPA
jgi:hypothetical protein